MLGSGQHLKLAVRHAKNSSFIQKMYTPIPLYTIKPALKYFSQKPVSLLQHPAGKM